MLGTKLYKGKYTNKEYADLAVWCNANGCTIEEHEEYYECVAIPLPSLEELKKHAEEVQYYKYQKEKYGIAWVERADGTKIGFDTDIDQGSQTDWNSVRRVLDDGIALGKFAEGVEPYANYKYWINETEKEYGIVTLTELRLAGFISSEMQNTAYAKFEAIKKEIEACTTVEEVQKYLVD